MVGLNSQQFGPHKEEWQPGESAHFEYHCNESHDSPDAPAWYRSHHPVVVLKANKEDEKANGVEGLSMAERADAGAPRTYKVQFPDGLKWDAWEDELLTHPKYYERPDPPSPPERRV